MVQMIMVMVLVACEYKRLRDGFLFTPGSTFSTVGAEYFKKDIYLMLMLIVMIMMMMRITIKRMMVLMRMIR